jgi:hypothetical protein
MEWWLGSTGKWDLADRGPRSPIEVRAVYQKGQLLEVSNRAQLMRENVIGRNVSEVRARLEDYGYTVEDVAGGSGVRIRRLNPQSEGLLDLHVASDGTVQLPEYVIDRSKTAGPVTRSSIPRGHSGGVRVEGPGGTYIQLGPLDAEGRATSVVARVDRHMLAQATGSEASGKIVGRAASQDRGHLLARILGGPDLTQNLAPLIKNINERDMRMIEMEIEDAISAGGEATITVTPIYVDGRLAPESFLMSVRWKGGGHAVHSFPNP